jgi:two-component system phosphate regulon sensor histidine kinase PhoR
MLLDDVSPACWSTMQSHSETAPSLHQVLQTSGAVPEYIQVKPKGFKAILQSTAEFLETHQIEANVFAKLPSGRIWREDIHRYSQTLPSPYRLFSFTRVHADKPQRQPVGSEVLLPLVGKHLWRGDYFLLIVAQSFASMMIAHRLRPVSASPVVSIDDDTASADDLALDSASHHRSSYLSVCCSMHPDLVSQVLAEIHQFVDHLASQPEPAPAVVDLSHLWSTYCPPTTTAAGSLAMVDKWMNWQLSQLEHLRQSASTYRRQALSVSNLSSQNEVLLNTLRLKDDFLNTVGQELRTPLTTIKTALTLLDSPNLKPLQRQRYMEMISHECDRQSALISGVLDLLQMETSIGQAQTEVVRLIDTVPPVVSTYQPLAQEKEILLAYTIPDNLPPVVCPNAWLRQIMIHLLNNSIKYTNRGGEVWVTACQENDFAEIEIRDTGIGIATADLPKIFDHFFRGRNQPADTTEGAGLGLSIVQQLLMYVGGTIVVNSQVSEGTTFFVRLPFQQE